MDVSADVCSAAGGVIWKVVLLLQRQGAFINNCEVQV